MSNSKLKHSSTYYLALLISKQNLKNCWSYTENIKPKQFQFQPQHVLYYISTEIYQQSLKYFQNKTKKIQGLNDFLRTATLLPNNRADRHSKIMMNSNKTVEMEIIFEKLEGQKDLKNDLRRWCRENGIKISFTVNMTITKSKAIFRKLQNTYKKGFGKVKTRWLQNELKLFHFAVLAVSVLFEVKISEFAEQQWSMLEAAFPNKLQPILQYEAKNFTINKNTLKQKWDQKEDIFLTKIVQAKQEEPKWNQIAIQLYIQSNREFFRNGKQCRQRWLNHLDNSIKHEKWTAQEDLILLKGVQQNGKKWSRIMKCFDNQRTEHMIKNRFLSLILKCRKAHPFVQDEQSALKTIFCEMGLDGQDLKLCQDELYSQRKLRPKIITGQHIQSNKQIDQNSQKSFSLEEIQSVKNSAGENNSKKNETIIISQPADQHLLSPMDCYKFANFTPVPTPSPTFLSPISFVNLNPMFPGYGYFQCCMNNFYSQMNANNLPQNHQ